MGSESVRVRAYESWFVGRYRQGTSFISSRPPFEPSTSLPDKTSCSSFLARVQVVHKSEKNLSDKSRYAYTFHVIEGEANYEYVPTTDLLTISRGDLMSASLFFV